ncbi:MAG: cytochrome c [Planctomycetes bacterium]|nr:cytochrome c [Planctomycetota bacterium]
MRKLVPAMGLLAVGLSCLTLLAGEPAGAPPTTNGFKPVATVHSLMYGQLTHFQAIEQLIADAGAKDRHKRLGHEAELLAELANLNSLQRDKADYRAWATDLRETALELAREAGKKKDADDKAMLAKLERIKTICSACHDKYQ